MVSVDLTSESLAEAGRRLAADRRPLPLIGQIQPYAWGGFRYLRELTGNTSAEDLPAAEWWLGAHPSAPALVTLDELTCRLDHLIAHAPELVLGRRVAQQFGSRLPFLLKVLDVRQMLSIQAHPTKAQAEAGYAGENARGVPLNEPTRHYKDDNHKPEAQIALTSFWLLCGFRDPADLVQVLGDRPELHALSDRLADIRHAMPTAGAGAVVRALYQHVMAMPQEEVDQLLAPLVARLLPYYRDGEIDRASPDFWVARAADQFGMINGEYDRGLASIYLLNLLHLGPGEGTFLGAGLLHAYLEGIAVEIMANSDNVIRGGLTPKHVDADELIRILSFDPVKPVPLPCEAASATEQVYRTPSAEFMLGRLDVSPGDRVGLGTSDGPEILVAIEGRGALSWSRGSMEMRRGTAVLIPAATVCDCSAVESMLLFRATVPLHA